MADHSALHHMQNENHHHHAHAGNSRHIGGHHLLQVENLNVSFSMYSDEPGGGIRDFISAEKQIVHVVRDLNLSVHEGEIVAVVGASGSGKTLMADSIMGIFEPNSVVSGKIWVDGYLQNAESLARLRGHGISLVPQSVTSLDPLIRVGRQVRGVCSRERGERQVRAKRQKELFERYGLSENVERMYPHELSGGMARRVLLCCALMDDPKLIVADEPTPGLDLELAVRAMDDFREFADSGGGVLLITHDIELALKVCDRIAVFKDGTVIEETSVAAFECEELLQNEFTRQLWRALPEHGFAL